MRRAIVPLCLFVLLGPLLGVSSDDEPIRYTTTPARDPVARLQARVDSGVVKLEFGAAHGYLESVLRELHVPASSQMLVFSKTSFQKDQISPQRPRALYFNDDAYVGWVQHGEVLELAAQDPQLGTVFYTLAQQPAPRPAFVRRTYDCTQCHESGLTQNVPGLMMRSVFPDADGRPVFSAGTFLTTDRSPFRERWGGWYATGTHGAQRHLGNLILGADERPETLDRNLGANVTDLGKFFRTEPYLTPDSDFVALMVAEHQTFVHNLITRASYETRAALRDEESLGRILGKGPERTDGTRRRISGAGEPLVRALLFCGEAPLAERVKGTSSFAADFTKGGPRDARGRSLRDFDLEERLFRYPCSYLIYSEPFDALPEPVKHYVYRRLFEVLTGAETSPDFDHISPSRRHAILDILRATKPGLPAYWRQ